MNEIQGLFNGDEVSLFLVGINLTVGLFLGLVLKIHFEKYSATLSGKRELARILPFLVLIVCLIISIVKSSLALSLGLVGALSIVRFRTPIKEPEELVYLFMAIAMGLGLGANQTVLTVVTSLAILLAIAVLRQGFYSKDAKALYLIIESSDQAESPERVSEIVSKFVRDLDLKRFDIVQNKFQITYMIDVESSEKVFEMSREIKAQIEGASVTVIDQSRIPGV